MGQCLGWFLVLLYSFCIFHRCDTKNIKCISRKSLLCGMFGLLRIHGRIEMQSVLTRIQKLPQIDHLSDACGILAASRSLI